MVNRFIYFFIMMTAMACSTSKIETLNNKLDQFHTAFRWNNLSPMVHMFDHQNKEKLTNAYSTRLNQEKIVDFGILNIGLNEEKTQAKVMVEYQYINESTQSLEHRREVELWTLNDKNWFLKSCDVIKK